MAEVTLLDPPELDQLLGNVEEEDMPDAADELMAMHERLEELPGQQYRDLLNDVLRSKRMLDENYTDLMNALDHFESNPDTWMHGDKGQIQDALVEFTRTLHNYLAMALSLRDHTYRAKDKLDRDGLDDQYSTQMDELDLIAPASFIIDLRNYMQHRRIPVVTGRTSTHVVNEGPTEHTAKILFDKAELLAWDNWSAPSHEVLEDLDDEFQIRAVITDFQSTLTDFYEWFSDYLTEIYSEEIKERDELIIEMAKKQEELFPGINEGFLNEECDVW